MSSAKFRSLSLTLTLLFPGGAAIGAPELVNLKTVDSTIAVELRYSGMRNMMGRPLYSANMPALVRPSVAARLVEAQSYLRTRGLRLKIWDAYRPKGAQDQLWMVSQKKDYVADPNDGTGSLHTRGVAVDATLVYENGTEVPMPTDFDDFTPAALLRYLGSDPIIRKNLHILQRAMGRSGFLGLRTEWWHFIAKDWQKYPAIPDFTGVSQNAVDSGGSATARTSTAPTDSMRAR